MTRRLRVAVLAGGRSSEHDISLASARSVLESLDSDRYELWDPWVIAAIVLWAMATGIGQRSGKYYADVQKLAEGGGDEAEVLGRLRASEGAVMHYLATALFVLVLLDMIFKPGA